MTDQDKALIKLIIDLIGAGNFEILPHCRLRMGQRTVMREDIRNAAQTSHFEEVQEFAKGKIRFEGLDMDGDYLEVVAAYEAGAVVISVF